MNNEDCWQNPTGTVGAFEGNDTLGRESMMNLSDQQIKLSLVLWGIAFEYKECSLSLGRLVFSLLKSSLLLKDCTILGTTVNMGEIILFLFILETN